MPRIGNANTIDEAEFTHRAFPCDKVSHGVFGTNERRDGDQRVLRRARSAHIWLGVAREALVPIEARPEPVVRTSLHDLDFAEPGLAVLEESCFISRQTRQGAASARGTTAHARVYGPGFGFAAAGRC